MHPDKVAARILLILSVVHAAAAAPATIRQRSLEVTKKVTPALERRANLDESSHLFPPMDSNLPSTPGASPSQDDTLPGSGTLQSQDETSPTPGDPELHSGPLPELGTSQLDIDQPLTSEIPQLQDDLPPTPGALPSEDDMSESSVSGLSQLHDVQLPTPGALWSEDVTSSTGVPQLQEDLWPYWADNFWRDAVPGSPPLPNVPHPIWAISWGTSNEESPGTSATTSGAPQLQNDPPPASGTLQLHHDGSEEFDPSYRWLNDLRVVEGGPSSPNFDLEEAPQPLHLEAPPSAPETHTVFNDALKQKLKEYAVVSAVSGASVGLAFGFAKVINDHSHGSQSAGRDLASSGVVGRCKHAPATTQKPGLACSR